MEFEEMRKVWGEQRGENMYVLNEATLHKSVTRKKNALSRRIGRMETRVSILNSLAALFLLYLQSRRPHFAGFANAAVAAATVVYIQYERWKRKRAEGAFGRSMLDELDHAIANARALVRFNYTMFVGYLVPLAAICLTGMAVAGAPLQKWLIISGGFLLAFMLLLWSQKTCMVPNRDRLLTLRKKLLEE